MATCSSSHWEIRRLCPAAVKLANAFNLTSCLCPNGLMRNIITFESIIRCKYGLFATLVRVCQARDLADIDTPRTTKRLTLDAEL